MKKNSLIDMFNQTKNKNIEQIQKKFNAKMNELKNYQNFEMSNFDKITKGITKPCARIQNIVSSTTGIREDENDQNGEENGVGEENQNNEDEKAEKGNEEQNNENENLGEENNDNNDIEGEEQPLEQDEKNEIDDNEQNYENEEIEENNNINVDNHE